MNKQRFAICYSPTLISSNQGARVCKLSITRTTHDTFNRVYIIPLLSPKNSQCNAHPHQSSNTTSHHTPHATPHATPHHAIQTRFLAKLPINPTCRLLTFESSIYIFPTPSPSHGPSPVFPLKETRKASIHLPNPSFHSILSSAPTHTQKD